MLVVLYNMWAKHAVKGEDGRIIGHKKLDWQRDFGRTCDNSPVDAVRALTCAGSITGARVINDFPPFICDSCEYVETTRKQILYVRSEQHNKPKPFQYGHLRSFAHS